MSKKILGIVAALGVVLIIALAALEAPLYRSAIVFRPGGVQSVDSVPVATAATAPPGDSLPQPTPAVDTLSDARAAQPAAGDERATE